MKLNTPLYLLSALAVGASAANNVIGGDATEVTKYPFIVSIRNTMHRCGGSIIDPNHILTAGHCVIDYIDHPERLSIRAGSSQHASGGTIVNITSITTHPNFVFQESNIINDIAVIKLEEDLKFDDSIAPLSLPSSSSEDIKTGADCDVIGWGVTNTSTIALAPTLNAATVKVVDHEQCVREYSDGHHVDDNAICAGIQGGGKDACQGDSGGPLVEVASGRQIGIVSWGVGCAQPNRSGVYTSVKAFLPWIMQVTSD
ncbi:S1 family serine peptidase [Aspergillus stella-maris]|uniref:S1 family serine peptidase n=1 Tax=Aspergillus stella-maris TaxID=1810926 RepID=UPI003CCCDDD4